MKLCASDKNITKKKKMFIIEKRQQQKNKEIAINYLLAVTP
ncbi:hypothetical protein RV18_GL000621 [Enterococcus termitis]|nr:hypothetical protein RV18_GL000621 [Enterococcus termitis]